MPIPAAAAAIAKVAGAAKKAKGAARAAGNMASAASKGAKELEKATGGSSDNQASQAADTAEQGAQQISQKKESKENKKDDFREKIRSHLDGNETLSDEDLKILVSSAGLPDGVPADWGCCERVDLNTGRTWIDVNETVLEQLANHCRNYLYTYKDEARELDEGIDTETPQVGPTAQEIEKVNPAAVVEDPASGAKFVDTQKLTMTLAGALGELARKVRRIERKAEDEREEGQATVYLGTWGPDARSGPTGASKAVAL